jgi:hypothetical protein
MEIRGSNGYLESLFAQRFAQLQSGAAGRAAPVPQRPARNLDIRDLIEISRQAGEARSFSSSTRLIGEIEEQTASGFRLVQQFINGEGRPFTRTQNFSVTDRGFRRDLIQENPSGSFIRSEDILDVQDNGLFRRTQRFTDETGTTQTVIENDVVSTDPFVVSQGRTIDPLRPANQNVLFEQTRGLRLDISA